MHSCLPLQLLSLALFALCCTMCAALGPTIICLPAFCRPPVTGKPPTGKKRSRSKAAAAAAASDEEMHEADNEAAFLRKQQQRRRGAGGGRGRGSNGSTSGLLGEAWLFQPNVGFWRCVCAVACNVSKAMWQLPAATSVGALRCLKIQTTRYKYYPAARDIGKHRIAE
jgi:hypothetical protein